MITSESGLQFNTFARAAAKARAVAALLKCTVGVVRSELGWSIRLPERISPRVAAQDFQEAENVTRSIQEVRWADELAMEDVFEEPATDDFVSDQDDWVRSEEEGWFYADN